MIRRLIGCLNDFENHVHAFVFACIMDQQIKAEQAWLIPFRISQRLGDFRFEHLQELTLEEINGVMSNPKPLHRLRVHLAAMNAIGQRVARALGTNDDVPTCLGPV